MKFVRLQHLLILLSTSVVVASAFVHSTPVWGKPTAKALRFLLQFKEQIDADISILDEVVSAAPISDLLTNTKAEMKVKAPRPKKEKKNIGHPSHKKQNIVIPVASFLGGKLQKQKQDSISPIKEKLTTKSGLFRSLRPAVKFRAKLGLTTLTALSLACLLVPSPKLRLFMAAKLWWKSRGFTGLAAVGRSITYMWALFVGYPRLLDRRAGEGRRRDREKSTERRRIHLMDLAGEVSRLRQELASIDAEIRSFRREIISLQVYAKKDESSFDVKEAIGAEMAHLAQLRSNTQANLAAAQHIWAEVRSQI